MYNYLHILFIVGLICMWKELRTQHEIDNFMKEIIGFHDSCIKEIKYSSGAYVEKNLSMSPVNTKRTLTVLIQ